MNYFRKVVNGPPCEMREEEDHIFRFGNDNDNLDLSTESGLIEWMCSFSRAQNSSRSTEVLVQNWIGYFQDIGISLFSYYQMCPESEVTSKSSSVMAHYGVPNDWKNSYLLQGFRENDPLMLYAFERNELFYFSDLQHFKGCTSWEKKYFDSLRQLNLSEGYALPIFKSGVCDGFFALGIGKQFPALDKRQLSMVKWACQMGHYRYVDLMTKEAEQASHSGVRARLQRHKSAQLSDVKAAYKVIKELKHSNIADQAQSKAESYRFQIAAAMQLGYREPFSKAQSKLNYTLMKMMASKEVTQDAWKLYHMLRQMK